MATVRALSLNLWGEQPPLARRLDLVVEGIRALAVDVVALQEVRESPTVRNTAGAIAERLGFQYAWEKSTPWGGGDEGLAILSRWPMTRAGHVELPHAIPLERRICLGASIASPDGALAVFTTHLNYRLTDGGKREDQAAAADQFTADFCAVEPTPLPRLLMGDFNATPDSDEIRFLRGLHSTAGRRTYWQDAFAARHPDERGYTWSRKNPYTDKLHWLDRDRRIDYVFVSPLGRDGRGEVLDCRIVLDRAAADGAFASDHFGLFAEVQLSATR